ncbi:MAG: kynureninase [Steroidobacteraceae bacterium]
MTGIDLHARAFALDASDPLAQFRDQFAIPPHIDGNASIYLCGHSLGLAPLAARELLNEELDDWNQLAVLGHHVARRPWIDYAGQVRPALAHLVGAHPGEVVAMNALTVNLHLLMASFYRPQGKRRCIVVEHGAFSSDRHAIISQIQWHGLMPADALIEIAPAAGTDLVDEAAVEQLLGERGAEVALVLWPGVQFRTGQAFDLGRIARAARLAGATCGFDLAHAAGNVPLALHEDGADFAVWCSYKYLNGGPGAIGGAFVHERHRRADLPGLAGWWGHEAESRFRMEPGFVPAADAAAWQVSNPPVFSAAPLLASLRLFEAAGLPALRAKSLQMTGLLLEQIDGRFSSQLQCITPRQDSRRGCQLSMRLYAGREAGRRVFEDLGASGVVADWREPDILRIAPVPLYNRFAELAVFCDLLEVALRQHA